jgi:hypothetical protein
MTADELIDGYVADVVVLLPRRERRDVAQELRMLLREEVDAAATDQAGSEQAASGEAAGQQAAREQAARALLASFGRPADVAARYGSPVTLIDAADTRSFLIFALAGAVLIPFGAVLNALTSRAGQHRDLGQAIERAWPYVFAWLGLLVVGFAVAAWARRRRPDAGWKPRPIPADQISRTGRAAAIVFFVLGLLVLLDPDRLIRAVAGGNAPPAAYHAFAYDQDFLRLRGPVVLGLVIAGLIVQVALVCQGRWRQWLHQADMAHGLVLCIALTWAVAAGPIFTATPTDRAVKGAIAVIIPITLIDLAVRTRRRHVRQAVEIPE